MRSLVTASTTRAHAETSSMTLKNNNHHLRTLISSNRKETATAGPPNETDAENIREFLAPNADFQHSSSAATARTFAHSSDLATTAIPSTRGLVHSSAPTARSATHSA